MPELIKTEPETIKFKLCHHCVVTTEHTSTRTVVMTH